MSKMRLAEVDAFEDEQADAARRPTKRDRLKGRPIDEPAGPRRANAMARSKDELDEQMDGKELATRALKDIKIDGEIVSTFNSGEVSNADPAFHYKWARYVKPYGGVAPVDYDLALTIRTSSHGVLKCWEKVNGSMVEAIEHRDETGCRKVGDVMLIRCRKDVYAAIRVWEDQKVKDRNASSANSLQSIGDRTGVPVRVTAVDRDIDDPVMQRALKHAAAKEIANRQLDDQLRHGRVRGMEVGG